MSKSKTVDRRSFLIGQVAIASLGICAPALALGPVLGSETRGLPGLENKANWNIGTADQFSAFLNQPFTAIAKDGKLLNLTLVAVDSSNLGPARPKNLTRSQSISLIFKSDLAADLAKQGHQTVRIWHSVLGESQLFLGAVPRRSGGYDIEAVLN